MTFVRAPLRDGHVLVPSEFYDRVRREVMAAKVACDEYVAEVRAAQDEERRSYEKEKQRRRRAERQRRRVVYEPVLLESPSKGFCGGCRCHVDELSQSCSTCKNRHYMRRRKRRLRQCLDDVRRVPKMASD